jgi:hypothetical protein
VPPSRATREGTHSRGRAETCRPWLSASVAARRSRRRDAAEATEPPEATNAAAELVATIDVTPADAAPTLLLIVVGEQRALGRGREVEVDLRT